MLKRIIKCILRQPLPALAVVLFSAVLSVVLCYLHQAKQEEQRNFEKTYDSVPVYLRVAELDGSKPPPLKHIEGWAADLFFEDCKLSPNFSHMIEDLQLRMSHIAVQGDDPEPLVVEEETLVGITSLQVGEELTAEYGGGIVWYPGFDETVFSSGDFVCIVPEDHPASDEVILSFTYKNLEQKIHRTYTCVFRVVGRHADKDYAFLYCPYSAIAQIYFELGESKKLEHISATLKSNGDLPLLRKTAEHWFAQPNPLGEPTAWGKYGYEHYLYALDINDTLLKNLEANMQNSIYINQMAAAFIFLLAAGSGFLTGFLVVRSRKREIALMQTLGMPNIIVCLEFEAEHILCVITGIIIGGSNSLWQPIGQLCVFAGIYIAGLTVALLVFVRANLLTTIKEDE